DHQGLLSGEVEQPSEAGGGNDFYNREHSWPNAYGFPNDGASNSPYTDCHHLMLSDIGYNGDRGSKPFDDCPGCTERTTVFNNGTGGPGMSNWTDATRWETWVGRQGDVARAQLYMDVRYEGGFESGDFSASSGVVGE
ncbi:MAG: endonuclease, partial [Acidobacteriota bacterium]